MNFDVTIIGSGPGGYVAAIRCAQLGFKTALIEKYSTLGGTCLNVGCIPSKALLDSSEHYYNAIHHFKEHGIIVKKPEIDINKVIDRKNKIVEQTTKGIDYLMTKNKITVFHGTASFLSEKKLMIKGNSDQEIESTYFIIATGSKPINLPFASIDKERIISSTEALNLTEIPKHLLVIGGGVIGLELGSVYMRMGAKVTVIEYLDHLIPGMDSSLSKELLKVLKNQGMEFSLSTRVTKVERKNNTVYVITENKEKEEIIFEGDYCLVAIGRKAYTEGLELEKAGIQTDERGKIIVNSDLQTNIPTIYAIGDVINGPMLAHKAEEEGIFVAEKLAGQKPSIEYSLIPGVIYTWPEVAGIGKTENQLKEEDIKYKVGQFPMKALGRARASGDTDGFVKIITDEQSDEILGVHIIAARAADLIAEMVIAMEYKASSEDIARICFAHPTYSEAIKEAALNVDKRSLHS